MTVEQMLREAARTLARGSANPQADAQILLAFSLGRTRSWLVAHGDEPLSSLQIQEYEGLCETRAGGVPVAYITRFAGFYGREFAVNESVLIPRPETEHLVEDAIAYLQETARSSDRPLRVFEAGTGSGAIGISIVAEVPQAILDATDISEAVLDVARFNARRAGVQDRCTFYVADIAAPERAAEYDLIAANLPYIPSSDVPERPQPAGFEPRTALDGGTDGLEHYRKLLAIAPLMLRAGGMLLLEAAPPTVGALREAALGAFPRSQAEICADYAGLERYVRLRAA